MKPILHDNLSIASWPFDMSMQKNSTHILKTKTELTLLSNWMIMDGVIAKIIWNSKGLEENQKFIFLSVSIIMKSQISVSEEF